MARILIDKYLEGEGAARWSWGQMDCTLFCAGWVLFLTGIDVAQGIRGTYSDEAGANAVIDANNGITVLLDKCLRKVGWEYKYGSANDGDIGVVLCDVAGGKKKYLPAIYHGGLWLVRGARGTAGIRHKIQWVWGPACHQ